MRLPRNLKVFRGQLEAAPFLSVLLLLLCLLSLTPKLVFDPGARIHIDLPQAGGPTPGITNVTVSVAIDSSGVYYYEGRITPLPGLLTELRSAVTNSPTPLSLKIFADKSARLDSMQQLTFEAGKLGFQNVFQVLEPPSELPARRSAPTPGAGSPTNR